MSARSIELAENLQRVEERIEAALFRAGRPRSDLTLIAVTKFFPVSDIEILYELGIRNFGENRDEEGALKATKLPVDSLWHFQGQVQGRKIKSLVQWAKVVHSLDSMDHAKKFNQVLESSGEGRDFFIQVNLEPDRLDRGGVNPKELESFVESLGIYRFLKIAGLMTVLPLGMELATGFTELARWRERLGLPSLSMGMSNDFESAIEAGATHIRVGSSILGSRPPLT
jgi:PLP dependent protein